MAVKVAIVTGSNCGLGFRAAEMLCEMGIEVIMACRSEARANEAIEKIKLGNADAKVVFMELDLADLHSVKSFSEAFLATGKPLHILINNAGILAHSSGRQETKDGFEMHMGTNHIGHFLLTSLLLDKLKETGTPEHKSRIVVVTSELHNSACPGHRRPVKDIDFDDIHLKAEGSYHEYQGYRNSKAANIMFTIKLARMLKDENVTVNSMTPGFIPSTELGRNASPMLKFMGRWVLDWFMKPFVHATRTVDEGAGLEVQLATDEKYEGESGNYYSDYQVRESSAETRDVELQEKLWEFTKESILEGDRFPDVQLMF